MYKKDLSRSYIVMRSPSVMEDEGRHFYINKYETLKDAKDWIASQKGEYFGPDCYYIAP